MSTSVFVSEAVSMSVCVCVLSAFVSFSVSVFVSDSHSRESHGSPPFGILER